LNCIILPKYSDFHHQTAQRKLKKCEMQENATGKKCTKESRLLNTPFGVCSVWHGGTPRIICPNCFLFGGNTLLKQVASHFLNESHILEYAIRAHRFDNWHTIPLKYGEVTDIGSELQNESYLFFAILLQK